MIALVPVKVPLVTIDFRGTEFTGEPFRALMAQHSIGIYWASPPYKAAIASVDVF